MWCFTKKLCTRCDAWADTLLWWSCQSPVAHISSHFVLLHLSNDKEHWGRTPYCLGRRDILMMENTFLIKNTVNVILIFFATLPCLLWSWRVKQLPSGQLGLRFQIIRAINPQLISSYDLLEETSSLVSVWIKSLATAAPCFFCSGSRSWGMSLPDMFHTKILHQNLGHSSFWNPHVNSYFSYCQLPIFVDFSPDHFWLLRYSTCCWSSRAWITFSRFLTTFEVFVPHFHLCCTHCIILKRLLNHLNSSCREMFKLNAKFDAHSLLYSLSHFECNSHTAHATTPTD